MQYIALYFGLFFFHCFSSEFDKGHFDNQSDHVYKIRYFGPNEVLQERTIEPYHRANIKFLKSKSIQSMTIFNMTCSLKCRYDFERASPKPIILTNDVSQIVLHNKRYNVEWVHFDNNASSRVSDEEEY